MALRLVTVPRKHAAIAWRSDSCAAWDEIGNTWDETAFERLTKSLLIDGMSERAAYLTDGRPCVVFPDVVIFATESCGCRSIHAAACDRYCGCRCRIGGGS